MATAASKEAAAKAVSTAVVVVEVTAALADCRRRPGAQPVQQEAGTGLGSIATEGGAGVCSAQVQSGEYASSRHNASLRRGPATHAWSSKTMRHLPRRWGSWQLQLPVAPPARQTVQVRLMLILQPNRFCIRKLTP